RQAETGGGRADERRLVLHRRILNPSRAALRRFRHGQRDEDSRDVCRVLRGAMPTVLAKLAEDATWGTETQITEGPWYPVRSRRAGRSRRAVERRPPSAAGISCPGTLRFRRPRRPPENERALLERCPPLFSS